jgi:hypothetical protein
VLCELRKKYMRKNLKEVSHLDSNFLMHSPSCSLNVETSRLLATVVRNTSHKPEDMRWSFKEEAMALSILKCGLVPVPSSGYYSPTFMTYLTEHSKHCFRIGINAHVFSMLKFTDSI